MNYKHEPSLTPYAKELRRNMTQEERRLWYTFLKTYPVRFLRQKVIDKYIADFYCAQAKLVIELDGSQHYSEQGLIRDCVRTEQIEKRGLTVIHIPNNVLNSRFQEVCDYIDYLVKAHIHP